MSTFVNTVEKFGDAALTDSIINRTVTEYKDNNATRVGKCAFRKCALLTTVDMPNITLIDENAFNECSTLTVFILRRTDSVVTLMNANALANTPIAGGTGYIYVPSALVDSYKADSVWSVYASQIRAIEDWPYVCDLYSWDIVFQRIEDGTYKDFYKVGDLVPLDLGSEGLVNMEIVAFDTDDLADGSGKAPITWISKSPLNTRKDMGANGSGTIWETSNVRTHLKENVKPRIPEIVRSKIKEVFKYSTGTDSSKVLYKNKLTVDDVWTPSVREVYSTTSSKYETVGATYHDKFKALNDRMKYSLSGAAMTWWLRTGSSFLTYYYVGMTGNIDDTSGQTTNSFSVVLGFCT